MPRRRSPKIEALTSKQNSIIVLEAPFNAGRRFLIQHITNRQYDDIHTLLIRRIVIMARHNLQ